MKGRSNTQENDPFSGRQTPTTPLKGKTYRSAQRLEREHPRSITLREAPSF
jgi:hypothetical protein